MSEVTQSARTAIDGHQPMQHGFGDGGSDGGHLFLVNRCASGVQINDFTSNALSSVHDLLDEAVANGGMGSNRAWLVQQLLHAVHAASDSRP